MNRNKYGVITEYGVIAKEMPIADKFTKYLSISVDAKYFNELYEFAKTDEGGKILQISKSGAHDILKAKSYVGVIQTKKGFVLEILPKIYFDKIEESEEDKTRKIFTKMLKKIKHLPEYKNANFANLKITNMRLLEIFINMFLQEVKSIVVKGIKSNYVSIQENARFLKGKLKTGINLRKNFIHKERFFVEYDEYLPDIPENRLIKTALDFLVNVSKSYSNVKELIKFLFVFSSINKSSDVKSDFNKCSNNRTMSYYENALIWAQLFLNNESFTSYKGSTIAFALLFPMEKVFEKYVLYHLRKKDEYKSVSPENRHYLIKAKSGKNDAHFKIKPDIVCRDFDENINIYDAKWKILDETRQDKKFNISQSDLYQLLSYATVYNAQEEKNIELCLVYPKSKNFNKSFAFNFNDTNDTKLRITPFDLKDDKFIRP